MLPDKTRDIPGSRTVDASSFVSTGFFVMRTPLLPFDVLLDWSAQAEIEPSITTSSMVSELEQLRKHLAGLIMQPPVREAIFLASPSLERSIETWVRSPQSDRARRIERSLVRYLARMAGRTTPFGLFAGCSTGTIASETCLEIDGMGGYVRHSRLDMDYVCGLIDEVVTKAEELDGLRYYPNTTLSEIGERIHYVRIRHDGDRYRYRLAAVEKTAHLVWILRGAQDGATRQQLVEGLANDLPDVSLSAAHRFVARVIDAQILASELSPRLTGSEPLPELIAELGRHCVPAAGTLARVQAQLAALDEGGIGASPHIYTDLARSLSSCRNRETDISRLFQVDLIKRAPNLMLDNAVVGQIAQDIELLHKFIGEGDHDGLEVFRNAFTTRYGDQEVPLLEVLDEEAGIGFEGSARIEKAPGIGEVQYVDPEPTSGTWGARETYILERLLDAAKHNSLEIELDRQVIERLCSNSSRQLPDAFAVMVSLLATGRSDMSEGGPSVLFRGSFGPSGATLLGRFCHADDSLRRFVADYLALEEMLTPDAVFAEIVHLPEPRVGNIVLRPLLRTYEVPILARSGADRESQIPLSDIRVAVLDRRVSLRSARLGRVLVPRLTSAHNFALGDVAVYRFLCALQYQEGSASAYWDWGPFSNLPFLPRVKMGRLVIAQAQWRVPDRVMESTESAGTERLRAFHEWRVRNTVPRFVTVTEGESELPVDLDNPMCVDSLLELAKQKSSVTITEMLSAAPSAGAKGPEGRFVHELIIPLIRSGEDVPRPEGSMKGPIRRSASTSFHPGSEWLYCKIYCGRAAADRVLSDRVGPLVSELTESGAVDSWFFVRYRDPNPHLRVRIHTSSPELSLSVLPQVTSALHWTSTEDTVWRTQFDTYERETERYGGARGIELAEGLFRADSDAALTVIKATVGRELANERWRIALVAVDRLLDDFGLTIAEKQAMVRGLELSTVNMFSQPRELRRLLGRAFRDEREKIENIFAPAENGALRTFPNLGDVFARRSTQQASIVAKLLDFDRANELSSPLATIIPSYLHMHINRLLKSDHRAHELLIYGLLSRWYESVRSRTGSKGL